MLIAGSLAFVVSTFALGLELYRYLWREQADSGLNLSQVRQLVPIDGTNVAMILAVNVEHGSESSQNIFRLQKIDLSSGQIHAPSVKIPARIHNICPLDEDRAWLCLNDQYIQQSRDAIESSHRLRYPTGTRLLADHENKLIVTNSSPVTAFDAETGLIRWQMAESDPTLSLAVSSHGIFCGTESGRVLLIERATGKHISAWKLTNESITKVAVTRCEALRDTLVCVVSSAGWMRVYDVEQGGVRLNRNATTSFAPAFSNDGRWLAHHSDKAESHVDLISLDSLETTLQLSHPGATGATFVENDSQLVTWGADGYIRKWDLASGEQLWSSTVIDKPKSLIELVSGLWQGDGFMNAATPPSVVMR